MNSVVQLLLGISGPLIIPNEVIQDILWVAEEIPLLLVVTTFVIHLFLALAVHNVISDYNDDCYSIVERVTGKDLRSTRHQLPEGLETAVLVIGSSLSTRLSFAPGTGLLIHGVAALIGISVVAIRAFE